MAEANALPQKHFLDLNSVTGVRSALSRLEKAKAIRRLKQGLYDYPRQHPSLGILPPKVEAVAKALSEKMEFRSSPPVPMQSNLLGYQNKYLVVLFF